MKQLKYILLVFITLSSCASSVQVRHEISFEKKGTRSERRNGDLFLSGVKIPYIFDSVVIEGREYILITRPHTFGDHGYFPSEGSASVPSSQDQTAEADLKNGFYLSDRRYKNTPAEWIFVKWGSSSAFIDSARIKDLLKIEPFSSLPDRVKSAEHRVLPSIRK